MLGASTLAQASTAVMVHGPAFLIPSLHAREGLSLAEAGLVAAAPMAGVMLALVPWGFVTDRRGERLVLLAGLVGAAVFGTVAALSGSVVPLALALGLAGLAAASSNVASGRVVVGWFPAGRRGLAMGIRQMAQPAGVGRRRGHDGGGRRPVRAVRRGLGAGRRLRARRGAGRGASSSTRRGRPPGRPRRRTPTGPTATCPASTGSRCCWSSRSSWCGPSPWSGWSRTGTGRRPLPVALVAGAQVAGALGRIAAGQLSDVVASRMRPLRWVTVAAAATMLALGAAAGLDVPVAVPLVVLATMVTVADNGLAFTAVAERAGPFWSGRALGAAEHRAVPRRGRRPAAGGADGDRARLPGDVRAGRGVPAGRAGDGAGARGARALLTTRPRTQWPRLTRPKPTTKIARVTRP